MIAAKSWLPLSPRSRLDKVKDYLSTGKDKLLISLVYFIVHDLMDEKNGLIYLEKILALQEQVLLKVKLYIYLLSI